MPTVTVSPKFQIHIPEVLREELGIQAGMKFDMISYHGRIQLAPQVPLKSLVGIFKGMNTNVYREKKDRPL